MTIRKKDKMVVFETERLIVRQFEETDKDNIFLMVGNETVMLYIRPVNTKEESDKFLLENMAAYENNPHGGRWAVIRKEDGLFAGSFAIIPLPNDPQKIQLGYLLLPENWGKGYATELAKAGVDYFMNNYSLPEIYGVTEMPNTASQKVLLRTGFKPDGSFMEKEKKLLRFVVKRKV